MSTTYQTAGRAIYDLLAALDISAITGRPAPGWAKTANYPIRDVQRQYPSFYVVPLRMWKTTSIPSPMTTR